MRFDHIALRVPTALLPRPDLAATPWSVIACDQYTSQPEYWQKVRDYIGNRPSTLGLILPEVFLGTEKQQTLIQQINQRMDQYLRQGLLAPQKPGFVLVDRRTPRVPARKGLIAALDLEQYDYREGAQTPIRSTEGTIVERLPPRIEIRRNAAVEVPHTLVLIDDPDKSVIEPLFGENLEKIYGFDLMMDSGALAGYLVDAPKLINQVATGLAALITPAALKRKYGVADLAPLLFALGDGNHSFAAAKALWESIKGDLSPQQRDDHPARWSMVELVNLHDEGLIFEPIHRVLFNVDTQALLGQMNKFFVQRGGKAQIEAETRPATAAEKPIPFINGNDRGTIVVWDQSPLPVSALQDFLDDYLKNHPQAKIDYIHGDAEVDRLGQMPGNIGFYLPPIQKEALFKGIIANGVLPRKAFSLGNADEKRFYMECRKIIPT